MKKLYSIAHVLGLVFLFLIVTVNCDSNNDPEFGEDLIPVNSITADGITVSLFATKALEVGTNTLYWQVTEGNNEVAIASFSITPMMDMGTMEHSTPHTDPVVLQEDEHYYTNSATFIMPSGDMGSWEIAFEIETQQGTAITGTMPVEIASSWKLTSVKDSEDNIYFISWVEPETPVTGNNTLQFMLFTRETMMNFPAVSDASIEIYPYMDMGGGSGHSTEFTNPVAKGDGFIRRKHQLQHERYLDYQCYIDTCRTRYPSGSSIRIQRTS